MLELRSELLERESEQASIMAALADLRRGVGQLVVVEGVPGIGKTSLLTWARSAAVDCGVQVLAARCTSMEQGVAFGALRQLFDLALNRSDPHELAELWSGPAHQARDIFQPEVSADQRGDFAVLHGLFWLTANLAERQTIAITVDDLQWCDNQSLRYLAYLAPRLAELGVLVVVGLRRNFNNALIGQLLADSNVRIQPKELGQAATSVLLRAMLPTDVGAALSMSCFKATNGNPLLLQELARTIKAEGVKAGAGMATEVLQFGPSALSRLIAVRMAHLDATSVALVRSAAVLGQTCDAHLAARLAELDLGVATRAAVELQRLDILRAESSDGAQRLTFLHPLVHSAIYASITVDERARAHHTAAKILAAIHADPERIAAHVLQTIPSGDQEAVSQLRAAAVEATRRGAPDGAYNYLRRCLAEPPQPDVLGEILLQAGQAALMVNMREAADLLHRALSDISDPITRSDVSAGLGTAYLYSMDPKKAIDVWKTAIRDLPGSEEGRKRRLEAAQVNAAWIVPNLFSGLSRLATLPAHNSVGGRLLDCALASTAMATANDPAAVTRARSALADGLLVEQANGDGALISGWVTLVAADDEFVMDSLDAGVRQAHQHGSLRALTGAYTFRALAWLGRGQLAEAEQDARDSLRLGLLAHLDVNRLFADAFLADVLVEQGRLDEAEEVLQRVGVGPDGIPDIPAPFALDTRTRLVRQQGDPQAALDAATEAERTWVRYNFTNPALAGWRTEAALALHALGRQAEAHSVAAEELDLARSWGAPRALGRTLRVNGLLQGGAQGLELIHEAVAVLRNSPARLELAKALGDLGGALRRSGHREDARKPLGEALDLASTCGATPLVVRVQTELNAAGARPRRTAMTGPKSLTPSEKRVAEFAARGVTNRMIAQSLFVTVKTVEVHLGNAYRKLGISKRSELRGALRVDGQDASF
jgi:DNA-binding CsgD family transcriptional regulator